MAAKKTAKHPSSRKAVEQSGGRPRESTPKRGATGLERLIPAQEHAVMVRTSLAAGGEIYVSVYPWDGTVNSPPEETHYYRVNGFDDLGCAIAELVVARSAGVEPSRSCLRQSYLVGGKWVPMEGVKGPRDYVVNTRKCKAGIFPDHVQLSRLYGRWVPGGWTEQGVAGSSVSRTISYATLALLLQMVLEERGGWPELERVAKKRAASDAMAAGVPMMPAPPKKRVRRPPNPFRPSANRRH